MKKILIFTIMLLSLTCLHAQQADSVPTPARRGSITPVDIDTEAPTKPVLHYYDQHGNALKEPVRFYLQTDTVEKLNPRSPYPLYNGVNVGINFADAIMMAAGQRHASFDVWANVSLHNWFFPTVEAGIGYGHDRPQSGKYYYHSNPAPYFKLGLDYNFLYKSNPDYRFFVGLRGGISPYSFDVRDVKVTDEVSKTTTLTEYDGLHATTLYGEALAGLQVKLYKRLSAGWTVRYRFKFHTWMQEMPEGLPITEPWFVPGYGASSHIAFTFSLIFRI